MGGSCAGAQWAVKVSRKRWEVDAKAVADVLKGACVEHSLAGMVDEQGPAVLGAVDVRTHEGHVFILMPRARIDLMDWLHRIDEEPPGMVLAAKLHVLHHVLMGIKRLHAAGFVHCDIKPENVVLDYDDSPFFPAVFLIDFDSLKPVGHTKKELTGTPDYWSPRYWTSKICGRDTDIWAAGVTMYIMLFGEDPYSLPPKGTLGRFQNLEVFVAQMAELTDDQLLASVPRDSPHARASARFLKRTDSVGFFRAFFSDARESNFGALVDYAEALDNKDGMWTQEKAHAGGTSRRFSPQCAHSVRNLPGGRSLSAEVFKDTVHQCLTEPLRLDGDVKISLKGRQTYITLEDLE